MASTMLIVVNPAAGAGLCGARWWPRLSTQLRRQGVPFETVLTARPGDATVLTREALRAGTLTVVAVGGDGTANEVLNGFMHQDRPRHPQARFGILGAGTGNDALHMLGGRQGALAALGPHGATRRMDVLRVAYTDGDDRMVQRYAFLHVGLGLIADAEGIALPPLLKRLGPRTYLWTGALAALRHRPLCVRYTLDGCTQQSARSHGGVVANLGYFGGGLPVVPGARVDDGLGDLVTVGGIGRLRLLVDLMPRLQRGTHLLHPAVRRCAFRCLEIQTDGTLLLAIDGDLVGRAPAVITVLPRALPLAMPPDRARRRGASPSACCRSSDKG